MNAVPYKLALREYQWMAELVAQVSSPMYRIPRNTQKMEESGSPNVARVNGGLQTLNVP